MKMHHMKVHHMKAEQEDVFTIKKYGALIKTHTAFVTVTRVASVISSAVTHVAKSCVRSRGVFNAPFLAFLDMDLFHVFKFGDILSAN